MNRIDLLKLCIKFVKWEEENSKTLYFEGFEGFERVGRSWIPYSGWENLESIYYQIQRILLVSEEVLNLNFAIWFLTKESDGIEVTLEHFMNAHKLKTDKIWFEVLEIVQEVKSLN